MIHGKLQIFFQMFSQISRTPDFERSFRVKRCGLYAGVYGNYCLLSCKQVPKKSPLVRRKPLCSPLRELEPTKKSRKPWTATEDAALVQFVALHKDKQPTEAPWPAMKAQHEYWTEVAMLNRTAGTQHLRAGNDNVFITGIPLKCSIITILNKLGV